MPADCHVGHTQSSDHQANVTVFHGLQYVQLCVKNKILHPKRNAKVSSRAGFLVQMAVKGLGVAIRKHLEISISDSGMPFIFFNGVTGDSLFLVIMSRSYGYAPRDDLRSADISDYLTLALRNVCSLSASRSDVEKLAFLPLTYCFIATWLEALEANHLYLGKDEDLAKRTYLDNVRMHGKSLHPVFCRLPEDVTVLRKIFRPPSDQNNLHYL